MLLFLPCDRGGPHKIAGKNTRLAGHEKKRLGTVYKNVVFELKCVLPVSSVEADPAGHI